MIKKYLKAHIFSGDLHNLQLQHAMLNEPNFHQFINNFSPRKIHDSVDVR